MRDNLCKHIQDFFKYFDDGSHFNYILYAMQYGGFEWDFQDDFSKNGWSLNYPPVLVNCDKNAL